MTVQQASKALADLSGQLGLSPVERAAALIIADRLIGVAAREARHAVEKGIARDARKLGTAAFAVALKACVVVAESRDELEAESAAVEKLRPTVMKLQESAQDLVRRMAAVARVEPALVED